MRNNLPCAGVLMAAIGLLMVTVLVDVQADPRTLVIERAESYRLRAEAGDVDAQTEYGFLLLEGISVDKDTRQGLQLLKKAARRGSTRAAKLLERLEATGRYKGAGTQTPAQVETPVQDILADDCCDAPGQGASLNDLQRQAEQGLVPRPSVREQRPWRPLADRNE